MNIGIMTFHWAANHGALLQTYALQKSLTDLIPDAAVTVVDYKPARYNMTLKRAVRSRSLKAIMNNLKDIKKERILAPFRDRWPKTYRYYSVEQLMRHPPDCDVFVAGSDQIWNEFFTMNGEGGKTPAYYLPFHPGAKHISYAASFGATELKKEMRDYILPYLQRMDGISVREETGKMILDQMGIKSQVVCDPSALLSRQAYHDLCVSAFDSGYTAKYFLRAENAAVKAATSYCRGFGKVNDISLLPMEQWLGAIAEADFLLTNSFHGVMAALKLHTPFAVFLSEGTLSGMNDRFFTLLRMLGIENRIVSCDNSVEAIKAKTICWEQVDRILDQYALESLQFLKDHCVPQKKKGPIVHYRNAECCGCTACAQICPTQSIQMIADQEGFLYPQVQMDRCVQCGKCVTVCPIKTNPVEKPGKAAEQVWIARSQNVELLRESSSGGVFSVLAQRILENQGVVFSVAMTKDCRNAVYVKAEDMESLASMRGSKYVQSQKRDVFIQVRQMLQSHRIVLFCGTPCDVNGLFNYLQQTQTHMGNLYLLDFICHGVPSPIVWDQYVRYREEKAGASIQNARFRNKEHGWKNYAMCMSFSNGKVYKALKDRDWYLRGFLSDLFLRPSCHECAAKGMERVSDITLGDAWGLESVCDEVRDDKGASVVFFRSHKAQALFLQVKDQLNCVPLEDPELVAQHNVAMIRSSMMNASRTAFMTQLYEGKSVVKLIKKYCREPFMLAMKKRIKRVIRGY